VTASANGWRVIDRAECHDVEVPGGLLPVHPELAYIAWDLAHEWHETVEPLVWPGCWGWARPTDSGRDPSVFVTNHASGTAWDLCAPKHPRGVPIAKTFTPQQLVQVSRLETRYFGVLRWGGRWTGADVDGMHWEGQPGVTVDAVRELTAHLIAQAELLLAGGEKNPNPAPAPRPPAATPAYGWTGPDLSGSGLGLRADIGANGPRTLALQQFLVRRYPLYAKTLSPDGFYGPRTAAVLAEFAHRSGIPGADGRNIGPRIARRLYLAGFRG
jgi:hypothetical protein